MFGFSSDSLLAMGIAFGVLALIALIDWIKASVEKPRIHAVE